MPQDRGERAFRDELLETMFQNGPGEPAAEHPANPRSGSTSPVGPEASREGWGQEHDARPSGAGSEGTLQLREEELLARKRAVEAGEVEIRKEVVTETRTVEVPIEREQLVIERRAGDHAEGEPIRIPLREQQAGRLQADSVEGPGAGGDRPGG